MITERREIEYYEIYAGPTGSGQVIDPEGDAFIAAMGGVGGVLSNVATVTSATYTVSAGGTNTETISNVPSGISKATFLAALAKGQANQTWNSAGIADTVVFNNTLVVTAQDGTTFVTYTVTYSLRETGPAGGLIFYDKGSYSGSPSWRYLEAAPSDQSTAEWGCVWTTISGADGTAVGTGNQNTIDIMAGCGTADIAARLCGNLELGGYGDWFLPSKDELAAMYTNLKQYDVGGFLVTGYAYWSSSEINADDAWLQYFNDGFQVSNGKGWANSVRAVRAF